MKTETDRTNRIGFCTCGGCVRGGPCLGAQTHQRRQPKGCIVAPDSTRPTSGSPTEGPACGSTALSPFASKMLEALRRLTKEREAHSCGGFTTDDMQWQMGVAFTSKEALAESLDELTHEGLIRFAGDDEEDAIGACYELVPEAGVAGLKALIERSRRKAKSGSAEAPTPICEAACKCAHAFGDNEEVVPLAVAQKLEREFNALAARRPSRDGLGALITKWKAQLGEWERERREISADENLRGAISMEMMCLQECIKTLSAVAGIEMEVRA